MTYFAVAVTRADGAWTGQEFSFADVDDLDVLADALRDAAAEAGGDLALLFVEEDDEYVAVVRVDGDDDPRVFLSDVRAVDTSTIAALLHEAVVAAAVPADLGAVVVAEDEDAEDDEEEAIPAEADPTGDAELLADLGTPAAALLALCAQEGALPADVISELCQRAGCLEVVEALR